MAVEYLVHDLEKVRGRLQRLHFLLTEPESDAIHEETRQQFAVVYRELNELLGRYLENEFAVQAGDAGELYRLGHEKRLYNAETLGRLQKMAAQGHGKPKDLSAFYENVRDDYVFLLRMLHDMLQRMGEEPEENNE